MSTPPCLTQTDGWASVRDLPPNFRPPRTSMPTFSLLLKKCGRALFSHLEMSRPKREAASKVWSWCKMEPDGHYYSARGSFHFSNLRRQVAKEQKCFPHIDFTWAGHGSQTFYHQSDQAMRD